LQQVVNLSSITIKMWIEFRTYIQSSTDLVENFDLLDNLNKMQRPICGSLGLQKLELVENFDLVENFPVTNFSTKSSFHCITITQPEVLEFYLWALI